MSTTATTATTASTTIPVIMKHRFIILPTPSIHPITTLPTYSSTPLVTNHHCHAHHRQKRVNLTRSETNPTIFHPLLATTKNHQSPNYHQSPTE